MSRPNLSAETSRPDAPQAAGLWAVFWAMLKTLYKLLLSGAADAETRFLAFEQEFTDELLRCAIAEAGLEPHEAAGMRIMFHKGRYELVFDDPPVDAPVGALPYSRDDLLGFIESRTLFFRFQRSSWFAERFSTLLARYRRKRTAKLRAARASLAAIRVSGLAGLAACAGELAGARAPP